MSHTFQLVPVADLLLDVSNPRLPEVQPNQQAMQLALATLVGDQIINIAEDIAANGLDPTTSLVVVKDDDSDRRYIVLEGNRRLLALRALETPGLLDGVLTTARRRRLSQVADLYAENPIESVQCVVFESPEDAWYWIELRHTGENGGVGLVRWGSNEQDRFRSRHGRSAARKPAGQILDFVDAVSPPAGDANSKILTSLQRLISTRHVRDRLGIETDQGIVYSWYPAREIYRGLRRAVGDLRGELRVGAIYYETDRIEYVNGYGVEDLPNRDTRLTDRVPLGSLPTSFDLAVPHLEPEDRQARPHQDDEPGERRPPTGVPREAGARTDGDDGAAERDDSSKTPAARSRARPRSGRDTVVPRGVALFIGEARTNDIYNELRKLQVDEFPNACAVLLRVFVELSVDTYITNNSLMTEADRNTSPLAKRLKKTAEHLRSAAKIDVQLEKAVIKVADGSGPLGTSTTTFNQFVHNRYVFPRASEVRTAWDELQPLLVAMWTR